MLALQMAGLPDIADALPLSKEDDELVSDVIAVLRKHGALNRFGLMLLHKHFELDEGEILLETTDKVSREQRISPVKRSALSEGTAVPTQWRFDTGEVAMYCMCPRYPNTGEHVGQHVHVK